MTRRGWLITGMGCFGLAFGLVSGAAGVPSGLALIVGALAIGGIGAFSRAGVM